MGILNYFILGAFAYGVGWLVRTKVLQKRIEDQSVYTLKHPTILTCLALFFILMIIVSLIMGRFILDHQGIEIGFVLVNSAVATFVFSFGLLPEAKRYDIPD